MVPLPRRRRPPAPAWPQGPAPTMHSAVGLHVSVMWQRLRLQNTIVAAAAGVPATSTWAGLRPSSMQGVGLHPHAGHLDTKEGATGPLHSQRGGRRNRDTIGCCLRAGMLFLLPRAAAVPPWPPVAGCAAAKRHTTADSEANVSHRTSPSFNNSSFPLDTHFDRAFPLPVRPQTAFPRETWAHRVLSGTAISSGRRWARTEGPTGCASGAAAAAGAAAGAQRSCGAPGRALSAQRRP
jgi:hypothetical protein